MQAAGTFSNSYYRGDVQPGQTVHLETTPIERIEPGLAIVAPPTDAGPRSTRSYWRPGFSIWDTNFPAFEIVGREGRELGKWWRENRFQAYQGVAVPNFPRTT